MKQGGDPDKGGIIFCCGCQANVQAKLTNGAEIYPHIPRLSAVPYWKCEACQNYVGCHHQSDRPTRPLGTIPTPALRQARLEIHELLDPAWKSGLVTRGKLYGRVSDHIGFRFHIGEIRTLEGAEAARLIIQEIIHELQGESRKESPEAGVAIAPARPEPA